MKILITGGCGFIGSNFIIKNLTESHNIILNYDNLTYAGEHNNLASVQGLPNYQFIHGNICDKKLVYDTIRDFCPDCIIHFAAESHVDRSIDDPMQFIKTNILGTANLLDISTSYLKESKNNNFRFIHISTDEVYGSLGDEGLFTENSPHNPSSPYSASKASSDHLARAWHKTYNFPIIITNCSNNYGPYQYPEKLIPLIIKNCIDEKPLPVYGKGLNIRDWLYVEDHCDAILYVLQNGKIGESYNIGGNNEKSNVEIVKIISSLLDKLIPRKSGDSYKNLIKYVQDRPGHDFRYAIDSSKIKNEIGWLPKETFESGIKKTINWYLDNENWWRKIRDENYPDERPEISD